MRTIDADALLKDIKEQAKEHQMAKSLTAYAKLVVIKAPTIDAEPVRHGHWVLSGAYACGDYEFVCSVCGDRRWENIGFPGRARYCQCCGAKMDGE